MAKNKWIDHDRVTVPSGEEVSVSVLQGRVRALQAALKSKQDRAESLKEEIAVAEKFLSGLESDSSRLKPPEPPKEDSKEEE